MANDPTQTDELLSGIESFTPDQTATNWKQELEDLVEGYRNAIERINVHSLLHSVQKDGIQNGWDGRLGMYGPQIPWKLTFELLEDTSLIRQNANQTKMTLLMVTDEGTVGLTGRYIKEDELYEDISHEERLARFVNKSWQKDRYAKRKTQGSRGRGKFIFVGASQSNRIIYDSLRYKLNYDSNKKVIENKPINYGETEYMVGWRSIQDVTAPYKSWFDNEANKNFSIITKNFKRESELKPLSKPGTRVIIPQPLDEIVESFKNGELEKWIGSTFWDIIVNCNAKIVIKYDGKETVVKPFPSRYPSGKNTNTYYNTVLNDKEIHRDLSKHRDKAGNKVDMSCLKFHIAYSHNRDVPEEYQGIAIIRAGMKITSYTPTLVPAEDRKKLFGYITLGDGWDDPIKEKETKEHYDISMRGQPLSYLQTFLDEEIERFGIGKGIWDSTTVAKKNEMRERTQSRVMSAVNRIARKFGLGVGPGGDPEYKVFMDTLSETQSGDLQMHGGNVTHRGEKAKISSSCLIGKIPKKVTFALKRRGTPTGTASVDITDEKGTVKQNIGTISEEDLQELPDSDYKEIAVEKKGARYVMKENDQVVINYSDGDSSNHICVTGTSAAVFDGTKSVETHFEKSWSADDTSDTIMKIEGSVPHEDADAKPVRLVMPALEFPNKSQPLRVNYDEVIKDISVSAINEHPDRVFFPINVHVKMQLYIGDPKDHLLHQKFSQMLNDEQTLVYDQLTDFTTDTAISFSKEDFPSIGRYTLVATLISMEDDDTRGDPIDRISKAIYLEEDPPKHGLFEKMEASRFSAPNEKQECKIVKGSHESYDFIYNIDHPECDKNNEDSNDLFAYLLRLMIAQIAKIDLRQGGEEKCKIFKTEDFEELDTMAGREKIVQRSLAFVSEALFDSEDES